MLQQRTYLSVHAILSVSIATMMILIVTAGCEQSGPVTAASSGLQAADDDAENQSQPDESPSSAKATEAEIATLDGLSSPANNQQPPTQPPAQIEEEEDLLASAEGMTEELLDLLERNDRIVQRAVRILGQLSQGAPSEEAVQLMRARIDIADKIVAAEDVNPETLARAVEAKLDSLRLLMIRLKVKEAASQRKQYITALSKDQNEELAAMGRLAMLQWMADELAGTRADDPGPFMQQLKATLADQAEGREAFRTIRDAAATILNSKFSEQGLEALRLVGTAFQKSNDEQLAQGAEQLLEQLPELKFNLLLNAVVKGKPDSAAQLTEQVKALLSAKTPDAVGIEKASNAAMIFEMSGNYQQASQVYALVKKVSLNHANKEFAEMIAQKVEKAERRLGLIGKPITLEGKLLDGSAFDWSQYRGKIVLIDFWATWCGPCIKEMPNIKENYLRFRDQGFEVVGINMDTARQRRDVGAFLARHDIPWPSVYSDDPPVANKLLGAGSGGNPNAERCGVEGIPFILLIGRDGKVLQMQLRGEMLGEKLEEIFASGDFPPAKKG